MSDEPPCCCPAGWSFRKPGREPLNDQEPRWHRGDYVKSEPFDDPERKGGIVLQPDPDVPLDRVLVHWPGDGEVVWSERIHDLEADNPMDDRPEALPHGR